MLKIKFHEAADMEAAEAIAWHEGRESGLGSRLRQEIEKSVSRIRTSPLQFPVVIGQTFVD